ncbi:unnamed protein product, partial [Amoebophrya sp. A120]|eukprot:GSA120T00013165001.1
MMLQLLLWAPSMVLIAFFLSLGHDLVAGIITTAGVLVLVAVFKNQARFVSSTEVEDIFR